MTNISSMQQQLNQLQQQLAASLNGRPVYPSRPRGRVPYRSHPNSDYDFRPHAFQESPTMNTSVPLQYVQSSRRYPQHRGDAPRQRFHERRNAPRTQRSSEVNSSEQREPLQLSTLLQNNEDVTFQVIVSKNEQGQPVYTTATSRFDGTQLTVTACDLVPSLVNTQSTKPGEVLYKFINGLKENGHLKRAFSVAPWKLCSVQRNGQSFTLEELRRQHNSTSVRRQSVSSDSSNE